MGNRDTLDLIFHNHGLLLEIERRLDAEKTEIKETLLIVDDILTQPFSPSLHGYAKGLMEKADLCKAIIEVLERIKARTLNQQIGLLAGFGG
jgi:hypothetical protein